MPSVKQQQPFDPFGTVQTTANVDSGNGKINQYIRQFQLFSTPQTQVWVYTDENDEEKEVVIKAVKRRNATRDKIQLLRRNNQIRRGALLSTEQSIHREIAIMKACRHSNIVRLVEVLDDPRKEKIYLVMEYLSGGKIQWQDENKEPTLTVDQTRRIFRDLVCGLEYLHYMGIVHRDIKPDNLVWSADNRAHAKIIDYGISHFSPYRRKVPFARWRKSLEPLKETSLFPPTDLLRLRGTEYFIAPEVVWISGDTPSSATSSNTVTVDSNNSHSAPSSVSGHEAAVDEVVEPRPSIPRPTTRPPITKAIDIWSLGVTLYCLLFGCLPFDIPRTLNQHPSHARFILYHEICTRDWTVRETMGADKVPVEGRQPTDPESVIALLDRMLQKDPKQRITLEEIKRHPWMLEGIANPNDWLVDTSPASYYFPKPYRWIRKMVNRILYTAPMKRC